MNSVASRVAFACAAGLLAGCQHPHLGDLERRRVRVDPVGTGPVDAVYQAINRIIRVPNVLTEFAVKAVTEGIDAMGEVTIRIQTDGQIFTGRGASTDIIVASAKAYMNALNKLLDVQGKARKE